MTREQIKSCLRCMDSYESRMRAMSEAVEAVDEAVAANKGRGGSSGATLARRAEELRAVWERLQGGESRRAIADELGIKYATLNSRLLHAGLKSYNRSH